MPEVLRKPRSTLANGMWIPGSVDEIEQAAARGDLEETASFDGKKELPPSTPSGNKSLAVDVGAMSTAGGSILYGVGEDADKRLTVRNPIVLAGAADRIAQIVQTSIAEVPHIAFESFALPDDPTKGYLLVLVPPSPRAPHQVTVRDDRRFYGRGAKGNRRLSEQEVALLYAQRQQREANLETRLQEAVQSVPYVPEDPDDGIVYAFAQPVPLDQGMWDAAASATGGVEVLQQRIAAAARGIVTRVEFDPSFRKGAYWHRVGADAWRMSSDYEDPPRAELVSVLADVTFNIDGCAVMFTGNAARRIDEDDRKYLFERTIAGSLAAFFAAVGVLFEQAGYFGAVDLGVQVTNIDGAVSVGRNEHVTDGFIIWQHVPKYNAQMYAQTRRLSAAAELSDAQGVALALVSRLFAATTGRDDYTPFESI